MAGTPKMFLTMLDMVTATQAAFSTQGLGVVESTHVRRVRNIFEDPNIVGAGIAEKIAGTRRTDTLSLTFYVKKKLKRVPKEKLLPPVLAAPNGQAIFTDVVEIGTIMPQKPLARRSPIRSGYSVGHFNTTAGTVGAIVKRGKKQYVLSNSHVLAEGGLAKKGDAIFYPGPYDGGTAADTIARLAYVQKFIVGSSFQNHVDAALAELLANKLEDVNRAIHGAKTPLRIADPVRGMRVTKMGRTTGRTNSVVRDVNFRVLIDYDGVGTVGFIDQVLCDDYTDGGDSGSIVVDRDSGAIVGLHFAGGSSGSIFSPIRKVIAALKFKF